MEKFTVMTLFLNTRNKHSELVVHCYGLYDDKKVAETAANSMRPKFPNVNIKVVPLTIDQETAEENGLENEPNG